MTSDRTDRIFLLGMMGSGKTTVGRLLAARLGRPFLDNDALVRAATGREPAEIETTDGADALHEAEAAAFRAAANRTDPVVAGVAGAVIEDPIEAARLAASGFVVWLRARPETLLGRIGLGAGRRREATDLAWLASRAAGREPIYAAAADVVVDVDDRTVEEVVERIVTALTEPSAG